jgi:TPR repeat protein
MDLNDESVSELLVLARAGNCDAQYVLGGRYYSGAGVDQDFSAAVDWFENASI